VTRIYKILTRIEWLDAAAAGRFEGSAIDLDDGYIHFSTAEQAPETARRYFKGLGDLMVLEVESDDLGPGLKWEPSRGGDLFPHLYGPLRVEHVIHAYEAPLGDDGVPQMPA
jgi:uncharacterized protein (DUF952 family)